MVSVLQRTRCVVGNCECEHLQPISKSFYMQAAFIVENVQPGPERTVALRKLLEAKDAAVRATVHPGG